MTLHSWHIRKFGNPKQEKWLEHSVGPVFLLGNLNFVPNLIFSLEDDGGQPQWIKLWIVKAPPSFRPHIPNQGCISGDELGKSKFRGQKGMHQTQKRKHVTAGIHVCLLSRSHECSFLHKSGFLMLGLLNLSSWTQHEEVFSCFCHNWKEADWRALLYLTRVS